MEGNFHIAVWSRYELEMVICYLFVGFMDDATLASNVCVFITAGLKTTANTLSHCLLELADNLNIQRKLREEILGAMKSSSICEDWQHLKYMDKVISGILEV